MKRVGVLGCLLVILVLAAKGVDCAVCDQQNADCNAYADTQHNNCIASADADYQNCVNMCQGDGGCIAGCSWNQQVYYGSCDRFYGVQQKHCDNQYTHCLNGCT